MAKLWLKTKVFHANNCYLSPVQNCLWHKLLHIQSVFLQLGSRETLQHKFNFKSITSIKYSCDPYWNRHTDSVSTSPMARRWNRDILRMCLSLYCQSPKAFSRPPRLWISYSPFLAAPVIIQKPCNKGSKTFSFREGEKSLLVFLKQFKKQTACRKFWQKERQSP